MPDIADLDDYLDTALNDFLEGEFDEETEGYLGAQEVLKHLRRYTYGLTITEDQFQEVINLRAEFSTKIIALVEAWDGKRTKG